MRAHGRTKAIQKTQITNNPPSFSINSMKREKLIAEPKELIRIVKNMPKDPFGLPSLYPNQPKRDSRRAFTRTQKNEILYQQDNKCARCHKKLDPRAVQFDHAKPWASGGRTIKRNGRALCGECHDIITHNQRLKKTDKRRKKKRSSVFDLPKIKLPKGF